MSSSDMRIIKDAKISRDPVVIAMHQFEKLDAPEFLPEETTGAGSADELTAILESSADFKSAISPSLSKNVAVSAENILQEARAQAEKLLADASQEVTRMKVLIAEEAEKLKIRATEDGKQQGVAEAKHQMLEQLQKTTERCNALLEAATSEARQIVLGSDNQIVELVLAISRKIIYDELEERPEVILGIVRAALERVRDQNHINIHVSLDDYESILQARNELQGIVGSEQILTITADTVLTRGGCMIETSFGTVEAGVDTQLDSIRRALHGIRG
ncbi:MAG: FliH/SctL family protein [Negativicutes bacterium]